ncbi:ADP-ribosylation family protein [Dactylosporangium sp. CS-033363]|uniref:ADP-ribosylation family protein n=1 Tax=Dactylosporangium sp. CS-033363 TaxID=3239935 RepID=UPI003D9157BE
MSSSRSPEGTDPAASVAAMHERFPLIYAHFRQVYSLRLPRHLAVYAAFWQGMSADAAECLGERLGLYPWGITELFEPGGLDRIPRDGLDERLHCRFRRDPAEFVTVMGGDTDGLHFGLWYDDPAELPSFIAHNYARDSAETWTNRAPTLLEQIRIRLADMRRDVELDGPEHYEGMPPFEPLEAALDAYAQADAEALAADGPPRWADAPRPRAAITIGPILPPAAGDPRAAEAGTRLDTYRDPAAAALVIAEARAELAAGRPALALMVGGELHWLDADEYRAESTELLTGAYRALGRDALAEIIEVHHAHRDLRSVEVLTPR